MSELKKPTTLSVESTLSKAETEEHRSQSPPAETNNDSALLKSGSSETPEGSEGDPSESNKGAAEGEVKENAGPSHGWQAIFSPQHNAYYFYNSITQETTWVNPMEPSSSEAIASGSGNEAGPSNAVGQEAELAKGEEEASRTASTSKSHYAALQEAALAQGIDPALAHLDPTLLSGPSGVPTDANGIPLFSAKFNRHTGAFAKRDARDPSHLSEFERAKRMSEFYFDVDAWQNQLAEQGGSIDGDDQGNKRKRPSKKDLDRFKEQKKQKKLAKTAWLRS